MTTTDASPPSSHHLKFVTTKIYRCLAPCKEWTGNYVSEILQKQFVCCCRCHHKITENEFGSATTPHFREGGI